jgi:hypothetical protein
VKIARAQADRSRRRAQLQQQAFSQASTELRWFLMLSVGRWDLTVPTGPLKLARRHRTDRPMTDARTETLFFGMRGIRFARAAALAAFLAALPLPALAQDAGVSGIPPGPGNVNGLNGSIRDPSGIGNASKMPALPPPSIRPATVPNVAPLTSTRPSSARIRTTTARRSRSASTPAQRRADRASVRENDRLLNHGVTSICRGC